MGLFTLPEGLAPELYPVAWLVGQWRGEGTVGYPGIDPFAIEQAASFTHDGGPYLRYETSVWRLDGSGKRQEVWHVESGYWRPVPANEPAPANPTANGGAMPVDLECLLADPAGYVSVYLGRAEGPRVTMASDLVARTATGAEVAAASRMYGLVDSDLLWAWDLAAFGHPLQSYLAARLVRQAPPRDPDDLDDSDEPAESDPPANAPDGPADGAPTAPNGVA